MSVRFDRAVRRLARQSDDRTMAEVATSASAAESEQLARLTRVLAESGDQLTPLSADIVDIASSGGPGSLSTLLAPLYAHALGARVAKIAVPGRPAGGLDVLASLPGYNPDLDGRAAKAVFDRCGYVHVSAGGSFCPLDARFFSWRQANGAQAIPNLAIASLLAKKLAAGAGRVVLDVRVGAHGNFGASIADARVHAERFVAVAAELDIDATCVLTTASGAAQPWIGRGEALVGLGLVLADAAYDSLATHADACLRMARLAIGDDPSQLERSALAPAASSAHELMLSAHGADPKQFWLRQSEIADIGRQTVAAQHAGYLMVDLDGIRGILVERQRTRDLGGTASFADPAGLILARNDGDVVQPGAVLARVRDDRDPVALAEQIAPYLRVEGATPQIRNNTPTEIISGSASLLLP